MMLSPLSRCGVDEGAELRNGDGVIPGSIWGRVPALMTEAEFPVPFQGGHAHRPPVGGIPEVCFRGVCAGLRCRQGCQTVDQPAMGGTTARGRDVMASSQVTKARRSAYRWASWVAGHGSRSQGDGAGAEEPVDRGMGLPGGLLEGGRRPFPVAGVYSDQGGGVKRRWPPNGCHREFINGVTVDTWAVS